MLLRQELQELKQRLYQAICPVCSEREQDGSCGLGPMDHCPIRKHLPRLVELTGSLESHRLGHYAERVRQETCADCRGSLHPLMTSEQDGRRAHDAYLLLVVQTIDDFLNEEAFSVELAGLC